MYIYICISLSQSVSQSHPVRKHKKCSGPYRADACSLSCETENFHQMPYFSNASELLAHHLASFKKSFHCRLSSGNCSFRNSSISVSQRFLGRACFLARGQLLCNNGCQVVAILLHLPLSSVMRWCAHFHFLRRLRLFHINRPAFSS